MSTAVSLCGLSINGPVLAAHSQMSKSFSLSETGSAPAMFEMSRLGKERYWENRMLISLGSVTRVLWSALHMGCNLPQ
jgi:hypothetical protein